MKRLTALVLVLCQIFILSAQAESVDLSGMSLEQLIQLKSNINGAIALAEAGTDVLDSATRKSPAAVGQSVTVSASQGSKYSYTMLITVDEFYRGDAFTALMSGKHVQEAGEGRENVAVSVTVTFVSLDSIDAEKAGTDDPDVAVNAIFNFETYTSDGAEYDNVHYDVPDTEALTNLYEGATTSGYFYFEANTDDPAPYLVYNPSSFGEDTVWISLK